MWNKPPQNLIINDNDVHIWIIDIENYRENIDNFQRILSVDEEEKVKRFSFDALKEIFIINRGYLRIILSQYLRLKPEEISFTYNHKGKPLLDDTILRKIEFNLSHKNNYTVYSFSNENIGIDLENINDKVQMENIAKRFFCHNEFDYLKNLEFREKQEHFFKLWTLKEAYLKAIGEGLSGGLDSICFTIDENTQQMQLIQEKNTFKKDNPWYFKTFNLLDNYRISIAVNSFKPPNFYYYSDFF
jgi:4'-phosphopantetheinyl transferase